MGFFWWVGRGVAFSSVAVSLVGCSSQAPAVAAPLNEMPAPSAALPSPGASVSASPAANAVPAADKMCGGIAGFRCDAGQYCAFPLSAQCGAGDMAGVCKPIPDMCTMEFAPVCGCDGKTYGSACVAGRRSVSVATTGACASDAHALADGALCGTRGIRGECGSGSYCAYKSQCGATDAGGVCSKRPDICNDLFAPVCGCDGKTYPNVCHAQRQGVSVAAPGACRP
jgi:Kazal-type serine protease inhibitor domain